MTDLLLLMSLWLSAAAPSAGAASPPAAAQEPEGSGGLPVAWGTAQGATQLADEALELSRAGRLRAAKEKLDACRKVAPGFVRCVLLSGSIYAQLAALEGNSKAGSQALAQARGFYERFVREACPVHPSCSTVASILWPPGEAVDAKGTLSPAAINQAVTRQSASVQACIAQQRARAPGRHGTLELGWTVSLSGAVGSVRLLTPALRDTAFASCLQEAVRRWTFPAHTAPTDPVVFLFDF